MINTVNWIYTSHDVLYRLQKKISEKKTDNLKEHYEFLRDIIHVPFKHFCKARTEV